ncbi:trp operon leader peptide [Salmonella enterica]|uniref:trp operon leader peptide n=1 Tax=Salmonella enterica TaxID=28901 RepID=A0A748C6L6_SALER|nr:trp operon leader peptide [Salmonella enterica]EBV7100608.1 trp operon leader peptide [Salmonella enterica subsp. enterica serovar Havana]ECT9941019.1 trp operon leader peptide [Salmonella enterica subsp. enterica serovar Java]EAP0382299.1 trp operon leader peptide [Salmonella enterica]EAW3079014.1 trp operon leader peptide [Salmonella enterica]EBI7099249.1 trp operon leader peptide [Salmonella enterica]
MAVTFALHGWWRTS